VFLRYNNLIKKEKENMNQRKLNNKGFSLVELIVVIAIMAVLIGLLAPQFIKYVQRSRYSTDVKNGQEIATVIQTLIADNKLAPASSGAVEITSGSAVMTKAAESNLLKEVPVSKVDKTYKFWATYDIKSGAVTVSIGTAATGADQLYPELTGKYKDMITE